MKKDNLATLGIVTILSTCTMALYVTKMESIILGVDIPSYFIFISMVIVSALLLLNKEDIVSIIRILLKDQSDKNEIPNKIYNFCKKYYFESEEVVIDYLKDDIKNKRLARFLIRYLDKNTKEEIDEYLSAQEAIEYKSFNSARKTIYYSNMFLIIGVISSYIYDSNIKGILLIAGIMCISNLFVYRKIESSIVESKEELLLYKNIAEDILNFKNAKYIMYKCNSILGIEDDFVDIDDLVKEKSIKTEINASKNKNTRPMPSYLDTSIKQRNSAIVTIGKNNKVNETNNFKREIKL